MDITENGILIGSEQTNLEELPVEMQFQILDTYQRQEGTQKLISSVRSINQHFKRLVDCMLLDGINGEYDWSLIVKIHSNMPSLRRDQSCMLTGNMRQGTYNVLREVYNSIFSQTPIDDDGQGGDANFMLMYAKLLTIFAVDDYLDFHKDLPEWPWDHPVESYKIVVKVRLKPTIRGAQNRDLILSWQPKIGHRLYEGNGFFQRTREEANKPTQRMLDGELDLSLPQNDGESDDDYLARIRNHAYQNLTRDIIDKIDTGVLLEISIKRVVVPPEGRTSESTVYTLP